MNDRDSWEHPKAPNPFELDKRLALVESQQRDIKQELHNINANISKLVWVVVGAVIVGVMNMWAAGGVI